MDKEFCLLDEKWIKVLNGENKIEEVSLIDVFQNAHLYKGLAGEIVTQDAAVFRVLLAIVITVLYRYDADGNEDNVLNHDETVNEILQRWKQYWDFGRFNSSVFKKYLEEYKERFYLFHPETPFWQVNKVYDEGNSGKEVKRTSYDVNKDSFIVFLGNVKESAHKQTKCHFRMTDGKFVNQLEYGEAARWLIYNNAYSVNVKPNGKKITKRVGVGWLGQIGLIFVKENNLFKDLMLNLCALHNGRKAWEEPRPTWETKIQDEVRIEITFPDNLPELYTIQSRRQLLKRNENGELIGFETTGGDFFDVKNNDIVREPMTLLKNDGGKIQIKEHDKEMVAWQEFPSLLPSDENEKSGLFFWIERLIRKGYIEKNKIMTFHLVGLDYYDHNKTAYGDLIEQSLSLSRELLSDVGSVWVSIITEQVQKCERVVNEGYNSFARGISEVIFRKTDNESKQKKEKRGKKQGLIKNYLSKQYYFRIDKMFREWLLSIDPDSKQRESKEAEWEQQSYKIATQVVEEYVAGLQSRDMILVGDAINVFEYNLNKIYKYKRKGGMKMSEKQEVANYIAKKMTYFSKAAEYSNAKAELAILRRGIGHPPGELPDLYGIFLQDMPESFWKESGEVTRAEWCCYITLTLYAWHQQGNKKCMHTDEKVSIGKAIHKLVDQQAKKDENANERALKKLQILISSGDMTEFAYHLKGIVTLLRTAEIPINYIALAKDIYDFQSVDTRNKVSLKWGQDFYRTKGQEEKENE